MEIAKMLFYNYKIIYKTNKFNTCPELKFVFFFYIYIYIFLFFIYNYYY